MSRNLELDRDGDQDSNGLLVKACRPELCGERRLYDGPIESWVDLADEAHGLAIDETVALHNQGDDDATLHTVISLAPRIWRRRRVPDDGALGDLRCVVDVRVSACSPGAGSGSHPGRGRAGGPSKCRACDEHRCGCEEQEAHKRPSVCGLPNGSRLSCGRPHAGATDVKRE